jgi:hypothetical protein
VLVAVLAALCAGIWFDRVGLPKFVTDRLVGALHQHGVDLEFSRMRLTLSRGLVAENVHVGQSNGPQSPFASAQQIALEINYRAAWHRRLQLDGLLVRNGDFILPLSDTNVLSLTNIQTDLELPTNDVWVLNNFKAGFDGIQLGLSGQVANGRELSQWEIFHGKKTGNARTVREQLQKFSESLQKIHFTGPAMLALNVQGDARDIHTFDLALIATVPSAQTAWGDASQFQLNARLTAPTNAPARSDASLDFWTNALPFRLEWAMRLAGWRSPMIEAQSVSAAGFWNAPVLAVTNLSAALGNGQLDAQARLDVFTRAFTFTNSSAFDPHVLDPFLTEQARRQFAKFSWTQPPQLLVAGALTLPAWTNLDVDWRAAVQPTVQLNGNLAFTNGAIQEVTVDSLAAQFSYSNLVWQLPSLAFNQSMTRLEASGSEDDATKSFHCKIQGAFDPESLNSFLPPTNAARVLHNFTNAEPVYLSAEMSGRLDSLDSLYATGHLAWTNFAIHEQHVDNVAGDFSYTNRLLSFFSPRVWRGQETMTADHAILDFNKRLIWIKNGYSTAEPQAVAIIIGPKTAEAIAPFHFLQPPTALINGCAPLGDANGREDPDLRFDVIRGAPFETHKFRATTVTGTIHWLGQHLILTNLTGQLYGGSGSGGADFDFKVPHEGADYNCLIIFTNVDLHGLMSDLSTPTNHLQGAFSGNIVVTHASTQDSQTADGYGHADLRNGLLWDFKIFGFFSSALNQVTPGLGNIRATDAGGDFLMTNGVIFSDTLQINASASRLLYNGTVDLKQNVNARVTAQLLHNVPGVGPVISMVFTPVTKLFVYKVTGNLDDPKYQPLYVLPKLLLFPLHPIRGVENIFTGNSSQTNAPAGK